MTRLASPGRLVLVATDGTFPTRHKFGGPNWIGYHRPLHRYEIPVGVPEGVDPIRWREAFGPWWEALSEALRPYRLDGARVVPNATPFAGSDDDAPMDAAWPAFAAEIRRIVAATGFWADDGEGLMEVHLNLKFHGAPGVVADGASYMNLSRDLRLQRYLRPFMVEAARRMTGTCPGWFASSCEMAFTLRAPRPTAAETFDARCALPEVWHGVGPKLARDMAMKPPGSHGLRVPRPLPERLYPGWDPLVDDVPYLEVHMESLFGSDPWRPAWVAFQFDWYHGELSAGMRDEVDAWVVANVRGAYRHVYRAVFEFEFEAEARAFVARWGDVPADERDLF